MGASTPSQLRFSAAQTWAYRKLAFRYPARYRELYLAEKGDGVGSRNNARAQGRAKVRLGQEHPGEYRQLREERVAVLRQAEGRDDGEDG